MMNRFNYYVFLTLLIFLVFFMIQTQGVNMSCSKCYKEGRHMHLSYFPEQNENHGPRVKNKFEHEMCTICKNNPGYIHYHFG